MNNLNLLLFFLVVCSACQSKKVEPVDEVAAIDTVVQVVSLPPLEAGEVFLKDKNPFGEIVELKGEHLAADTFIFKPKESQMLICGDKLIMKNLSFSQGEAQFHVFQYPEMVHIESAGLYGNGVNEFLYPFIIPTSDTTLYAFVLEATREKMYRLDKQGVISPSSFHFPTVKADNKWSDKLDLVNLAPNDFIYADNSKTGKSIFRTYPENDSIVTKELFSLQLNPKRKSPFTYIGDFGVNPAQKRMVYAYKYFKILKFMDMETGVERIVNFQQGDFNDGSLTLADGLDQNVTHYWGMSANDEYVYCFYSGRTPMEVLRDGRKGNFYIYLEQFDWNGNPVRKYKLDHWGRFTVDEKNKRLILLSTWDDDPFFFYQLL